MQTKRKKQRQKNLFTLTSGGFVIVAIAEEPEAFKNTFFIINYG